MGERLNSSKEALRKAISSLEGQSWDDLSNEEVEDIMARILFAREALVKNENKIWLKTKKGREMLGEYDIASKKVLQEIESGSDIAELRKLVNEVEEYARRLNKEIRQRSMVVT